MSRIRIQKRPLAAIATLTFAAGAGVPAFAASSGDASSARPTGSGAEAKRGERTSGKRRPAKVSEHRSVARIARWARQAKAATADGPFVPVVGEVDYGTAGNAFGAARSGHMHTGHDLFAPAGRPLVAVDDGIVAETGSDGGQGNYVYLYDPRHKHTYVYMHMVEPAEVKQGEKVDAGERLGAVGCTGSCWGDHLHFEIRGGKGIAGEAQDPLPKLRKWDSIEGPR